MKKVFLWFTLSLITGWLTAQSTTVSTTGLIDTDGNTWAGGTYSIQFKPNPLFPGINTYVWTGGNLQNNLQFNGTLNGSGAFSVSIPDSTTITPAGSSWTFIICPNATSGCFNTSLPVFGATFSVTSQLNSLALGPRFPVSISAHGYADVEITPTPLPGGMYYNVTVAVQRQWNGTAWTTLGGGGGSGTVQPSPQFQIGFFPNPGTNAVVGGAGATTDSSGNVQTLSTNGLADAFKHQSTPTSNNGIFNALQTSGNQVLVGPDYANTEAIVGVVSYDWRIPLDFVDAPFFYSQSPSYATNTIFEDQRYNGGGVSNKGLFVYDSLGYQTGIAPPAVYNRFYYDQHPLLSGQGIATIGMQNDYSRFGSGKDISGQWDTDAAINFVYQDFARGISSPWVFQTQCMGIGDCHPIQNSLLYGGNCSVGSDECNALYRNQSIEDFIVWTATSPSNQAAGATQILGTVVGSAGIAGDGNPLLDSTQATAQFLITATNAPPAFNSAGNIVTSGVTWTPDNIGRVITSYTTTAIPPQYNGGTTSLTITVTSLTSALTTGTACWADSNFNEQVAVTAVGSFSGGTQTATVSARYEHITDGTAPHASYFSQGPQACKYVEALANRKQGSSLAPLRNWARIIGCVNSSTCEYAVTGAGNWELWPGGAFTTFNFPTGTTLTRDGAGHTSMTISSFNTSIANSYIRIHAVDTTYNGDFQITLTEPTPGTIVLTWPNTGSAGTTTTTTPIYLITNQTNLGFNAEANAGIMIPGAEITYTGDPSTHTMSNTNGMHVEANNMTVANGDQLEAQHGNQLASALDHNLIANWTSTSISLGSSAHFSELTGNLQDGYTWNNLLVSLDLGETQLLGDGGTRVQSSIWQSISGNRIWNQFLKTPAPATDLWFIGTCPLVGCTLPSAPWNFFDIQNGHSSFQMQWTESSQTFSMTNALKTFFVYSPTQFQFNGNDGAGNNFFSNYGLGEVLYGIGDTAGDASSRTMVIGSITDQVKVGSNTSNFTQTPTAFTMDHALSVTGNFTATGTTTLATSLNGCVTATAGVISATGIACGSGGGGGVTSVGLSLTGPIYTISGSPVTTTGTLTGTLNTQTANTIFAGPASGSAAAPTFRTMVVADLPTGIPDANLASQSANTVLGALTATTPSPLAVPSCFGSTNALIWTPGTGFGCNTITSSSVAWSAITNPTTTLSLSMGNANTTTWTVGAATAANNMFTWTDTATNSSATGILAHFTTTASSTLIPWQADVNGLGWKVAPDGTFDGVGSSASHGMTIPEGTPVSGVSSSDVITTDSSLHRAVMNNNNGGEVPIAGLIASGTITMATSAISSATCATTTVAVTGVLSTDAVAWNANGSLSAVTGYVPATTGGLTLAIYPTSGHLNVDNCNWTSGSITPGAVTLNYAVTR